MHDSSSVLTDIRHAETSGVVEIMTLIRSCVSRMEAQGIYQWDEVYPDEGTIRGDLERGELFLLHAGDRIAGIIVLNEHQEPEYLDVPWRFSGNALVVHRLAVDPAFQGQGFARELMRFAHEYARERRYEAIRLDAYTGNPGAVVLYERLGYRKAGCVRFPKGLFYCFEMEIPP